MSADVLVLVTRPAADADPVASELRRRGFRVAAVPTVATSPVGAGGPLDNAIRAFGTWDWIVVTSVAGARAVSDALGRIHGSPAPARIATTRPGSPRWAAVGDATAAALIAAGLPVDLIPAEMSGIGIARELAADSSVLGARILLARADRAADDLPRALRAAGAQVHEVVAYRTLEAPAESGTALAAALDDPALAAIVVASGSAVRGMFALAEASGNAARADRARSAQIVSIGPKTSAVAREFGCTRIHEAAHPSSEAVVQAVEGALGGGESNRNPLAAATAGSRRSA